MQPIFKIKCECCCENQNFYGECGQRSPALGCNLYGTTYKYIKGGTPTCNTDNPTYPDLAVNRYFSLLNL